LVAVLNSLVEFCKKRSESLRNKKKSKWLKILIRLQAFYTVFVLQKIVKQRLTKVNSFFWVVNFEKTKSENLDKK